MNLNNSSKILVVDDDMIDREILRRAFEKLKIANDVIYAIDGVDALEKIDRECMSQPNSLSLLAFIDLNMPRMNGIELIQNIRKRENLQSMSIFVLTTSKNDEDIMKSYDLNVAGYIVKTDIGDNFSGLMSMLKHYWSIVEIPSVNNSQSL